MDNELKELIKEKGLKEKGISKDNWSDNDFKDIELQLLGFYEVDGKLDEEFRNDFINDLQLETDKHKVLSEYYQNAQNIIKDNSIINFMIQDFVNLKNVDQLINVILDGYGIVLENNIVASIDLT
ncbi:hypothetical protein [Staphylococcus hominis]|uniref:hypothetical protein n=1 Tax=Staphylococcus hominis TaxID=1290 RepID=UPI001F584A1B|nr:hypothetical protein [Staphylococcus hominis]MCI2910905.1 hypothetical protein [Staphylococcus hominis]